MTKPASRSRRRRSVVKSRPSQHEQSLLARILATPNLPDIVPRLQPEILHGVIQTCGLEDCAELVALATPAQLLRVFDLDLWHGRRPGADARLNADRFGVWLEVLLEAGVAAAAEKLIGLDADLVTTALAEHLRVFDRASVTPYLTLDGDELTPSPRLESPLTCDIGGYAIDARRPGSWEAIVALLLYLDANHPAHFNRLMAGCRDVSNAGNEIDGLDDLLSDREQDMLDQSIGRDERLEKRGYVAPAAARSFLQMARQLRLDRAAPPQDNPVAGEYFRSIEWIAPMEAPPPESAAAVASFVDVLVDAGVVAPQPRALLDQPRDQPTRLSRFHDYLRRARDGGDAVLGARSAELAYLANTMVAGCSIQGRAYTVREASDAVAAICNLGLENWPPHWRTEQDEHQNLVAVFQVGWTILHDRVCMYAANRLVGVLAEVPWDDAGMRSDVNALRSLLTRHVRDGEPWHARPALDVLMTSSMPAWAALLGLIDECPVLHAAIGVAPGSRILSISASAVEPISENSQIAAIHEFLERLPDMLRD
jgi:hypothetical protein